MGCLWSCIKWYFIIKLAVLALLLISFLISVAFVYIYPLVGAVFGY